MKKFFALTVFLIPSILLAQGVPVITLNFPYTSVMKGGPVTVTWSAVDSDNTEYGVKLAGGTLSPARTIGTVDTDSVENLTVTIPTDVPVGSGYVLQFVASNGTIYPSQAFSITSSSSTQQVENLPVQNTLVPQSVSTSTATTTTPFPLQELKRVQNEIGTKTTSPYSDQAGTSCVVLTSNIGYGAKDGGQLNTVALVQSFLFEKRYLSVRPTGYVGPKTVSAIIKFQKDNSIRTTGVLGPITRAKIQKISCAL